MAGDIYYVIYSSQYAEVAVAGFHRAVTSHVGPIVPVLAIRILANTC